MSEKNTANNTAIETVDNKNSYEVASQWKLMWWKFKKHKAAMIAVPVLILMYLICMCCEFFGPSLPLERYKDYKDTAPTKMHLWDYEGNFQGPFVYGLTRFTDPYTFRKSYIENEEIIKLGFFVRGSEYNVFGMKNLKWDVHFFGPKLEEGTAIKEVEAGSVIMSATPIEQVEDKETETVFPLHLWYDVVLEDGTEGKMLDAEINMGKAPQKYEGDLKAGEGKKGTVLTREKAEGDWFNVTLADGQTGLLHKDYIKVVTYPTEYFVLEDAEVTTFTTVQAPNLTKLTEVVAVEDNENWLLVTLEDGTTGYTFASLVAEVTNAYIDEATGETKEEIYTGIKTKAKGSAKIYIPGDKISVKADAVIINQAAISNANYYEITLSDNTVAFLPAENLKTYTPDETYEMNVDATLFNSIIPGYVKEKGISVYEDTIRELPGDKIFFLMGTDTLGRDVFSRILSGGRISLSFCLVSVFFTVAIGLTLGGLSGYLGGLVDTIVQRAIDLIMSIPGIPMWMALAAALPSTMSNLKKYFLMSLIMSLIGWTGLARVTRGKILSLREEDFVTAARMCGSSHFRVIFKHMIPSFLSYIIVSVTGSIPGTILGETSLSFLGLGLQAPTVSWGTMLQDCQTVDSMAATPWLMFPALFIIISVLCFCFMGDGLRDAADPYK